VCAVGVWLVLSAVALLFGRAFSTGAATFGDVARGVGVASFPMVLVSVAATAGTPLLQLSVYLLAYSVGACSMVLALQEALQVRLPAAILVTAFSVGVVVALVFLVLTALSG
jgi:hypothetical protein